MVTVTSADYHSAGEGVGAALEAEVDGGGGWRRGLGVMPCCWHTVLVGKTYAKTETSCFFIFSPNNIK